MRKTVQALIALGLVCSGSTRATTVLFDFNSDPSAGGLATVYGSAGWVGTDGAGVATNGLDGYLQITPAVNSQVGAILFSDFDNGAIVGGLHFEADVRIGNGSSTPADGFSICYARATDPALSNPTAEGTYASGTGNALGPEEGTTTGISVGFDAFNNAAGDPVGLDVRVDGVLQTFPLPTLNGSATDTTSIQTGPNDGTFSRTLLGWAHLVVDLSTSGLLNVYYKGSHILTDYATSYIPGPGRLLVAGRTGGLNEYQDIDNIAITTVTIQAALGQVTGFVDGCTFVLNDSGPSVVDPATIKLQINGGTQRTPTSVQKNGTVTTVVYHSFPSLLVSGSTNQLAVSFKDTSGAQLSGTRSFVAPTYSVIPSGDAVTGVNTTAPGFRILPWQSGSEPNRVYWANEQLAGLRGANTANLTAATDAGYIDFTAVINFNIAGINQGGTADSGDFTMADGYADAAVPGIPGANGLTGSSALEALAFVRFATAGVYNMGVNSDDGFAVTEGPNPKDRLALTLGQFDGVKGASDRIFPVVVPAAGIYPIRLLWFNGAGELPGNGASLEWFTVQNDGTKILINDPSPTNTSGVTMFYSGPALPAYVSQLVPFPGQTNVRADYVLAQLTDGATQPNPTTMRLRINGTLLTPWVSRNGKVTTVTLPLDNAHLMPPGTNTASLTWTDNGSVMHTSSWSFTVEPYVTLRAGLSYPASSVDKAQPGFVLAVTQLDPSIANDAGDYMAAQLDSYNSLLAGLYFPWYGTNTANTVSGAELGLAAITNNIWYWSNAVDFNIVTSPGDFTYDSAMPGIPGVTGQTTYSAAGFQSFVVFPTAGFYQMGVNSDDGFRVTEGLGVTRQVLHVTGAGIDTDVAAVVTSVDNAGYAPKPPVTPVSGPVVFVPVPCPNLPGPVNLTGKIGVVDYSSCASGFDARQLAYNLQTNGALAAIIVNKPSWGLPFVETSAGPPVTIPMLVVNGYNGQRDFWVTDSGLSATIGSDANLVLGQADYTKGMGHVDFGFAVPAPGAYPLRLLYFQGNNGAGLEWSTVQTGLLPEGTRVLVNDPTAAGSLQAFRAVTAQPQLNPAKLANGVVTISWAGAAILQQATRLNPADWADVQPQPGNTSYSAPVSGGNLFFRLRVPSLAAP
ncbi:MAG TPA: hypothetical protein VNZ64_06460 [Candidatus Acidoferrum sp.]|nr:hypothetical protein [Candidatus Acidoferrum sp.]